MTRVLITAMPTITASGNQLFGNPAPLISVAVRTKPIDKICILHDLLPSQEDEPLPSSQSEDGDEEEATLELRRAVQDIRRKMGVAVEIVEKEVELENPSKLVAGIAALIKENKGADIILDITSILQRKWGMLFASFACAESVHEVVCLEDDGTICTLPKLNFNLSEKQKALLKAIEQATADQKNPRHLAETAHLSRAMYYLALRDLRSKGLVDKNAIKLTDAGNAARTSHDQLGNSA